MSNQIENSKNSVVGNTIGNIGRDFRVENITHIYGEKQIKKYLTIPPFQSDYFIGREDDLTAIHEKLFQGENLLLLVNGRGGMGKTTIAAKYFKKYEADYQHLAWVFTGESLLDALLTLAIPLQVQFGEKMPNEERLPLLLQAMANLKKPCLLVIDNANDPKELQKYYLALRTCSNFHLLLTTRITSFENAEQHQVKPLERDDRFSLFQKHYPKLKSEEHELLSSIMTAVGNNTLVIELLAKNLRQFNRLKTNYSLAQLWEDLQHKGLLSIQGKAVTTAYQAGDQLREAKPETIIAAMYDLNDISPAERQLLSIFAVLPAENIPFAILENLLEELDGLEDNLLSLVELGWLEFDEVVTTFKVSPVVQEIVMQKNEDLSVDCEVLFDRLHQLLSFEANTGNLENISFEAAILLVQYAENIINSISSKNNDIAMLCERVGKYFETTGDLMNALRYFDEFNWLEQQFLDQNPNDEYYKNTLATTYVRLGETQSLLGNLEKALEYFEEYNKLERELYESYPENVNFKNGLAISYEKLGSMQSFLGNLEKALEYFEERSRLGKELYKSYPENINFKNGLAISYEKLGSTQSLLGNLEKALEYFELDAQLSKELYGSYPENVSFKNGLAISYGKLGSTQSSLGNLEKALEYFEEYARLEKELYESYPENVSFKNSLAISYEKLGETQSDLGNLEKALEYFELDAQLSRELCESYPENVSFKNGLAISHQWLGIIKMALNHLDSVFIHFENFQKLMRELVASYPQNVEFKNNLAWSYRKLGELASKRGNKERALEYFIQAKQHWSVLATAFPAYAEFQSNLDWVNERITKL